VGSVFILSSFVIFFIIYRNAISDRPTKNKIKIYNEDSLSLNDDIYEFKANEWTRYLKGTALPEKARQEITHRINRSIKQFGKDETIKNLIMQYQICIENELSYEKIAWLIGAIFVPASLTITAIGLNEKDSIVSPIVIGFILFITWILLFNRFRISIRLYRDCAKRIEEILGLFSISYVYDFSLEKYGSVIRVWPYLVTLSGFYFNFTLFILLK
jgi:hypothetical protein